MLKKFLIGAAAGLGVALAAGASMAADLPVFTQPLSAFSGNPAYGAFNWTGAYAGLNVGIGIGQRGANGGFSAYDAFGDALNAHLTSSNDGVGVLGGGQIGYNYQIGNVVIGGEGDFNGSGYRSHAIYGGLANFAGPASGIGSSNISGDVYSKIPWFGTVRPRVGLALDHVLLYGTGGFAIAQVDDSVGAFASDRARFGWTAGGGGEYYFGANWSAKLEYLFADFGNASWNIPGSFAPAGGSIYGNIHLNNTLNIIRTGIDYHW